MRRLATILCWGLILLFAGACKGPGKDAADPRSPVTTPTDAPSNTPESRQPMLAYTYPQLNAWMETGINRLALLEKEMGENFLSGWYIADPTSYLITEKDDETIRRKVYRRAIWIAITKESMRPRVERELDALGIPADAVILTVVKPVLLK